MVPPTSRKVPRVLRYSGSCRCLPISDTGLSPSMAGFPKTILLSSSSLMQSITPGCTHPGLGSFPFARRYSGHRGFFLFLRVLRCFSSPGSLPYVMDWRMDDRGPLCQVSPFRNPRINGYLLLPAAFRSLSRLSSALSAKASALRPYQLNRYGRFARYSVIWSFSVLFVKLYSSRINFLAIYNRISLDV